ncbi:outer membrane beta-barrel protein [Pleionea mediterranea]|jgi:hypothetical protein|uniref:Opacity protein-like surface antigen n=1 Tax=Pleionea mediterranea TaxID=523701 RepID=A0A316G037_9GAMM|nr:outer membrane beta-barrel protein [Pleionea mediterranea]PWK54178.1 opacity protein-like surface antigen [Pleionea mediterranea]
MRNIVFVILATALAQPVLAENSSSFSAGWYGDIHLGQTGTSLKQGEQSFDFLSIGGSYGYQYNEYFAAEFFGSFATDGEHDDIMSAILGQEAKVKFDAIGAYLVGKTHGKYYLKARVGLINSRFTYSAGGFEDETGSDTGFSYGFGAGVSLEKVNIELNYLQFPDVDDPLFNSTSYESDQLTISIGTQF